MNFVAVVPVNNPDSLRVHVSYPEGTDFYETLCNVLAKAGLETTSRTPTCTKCINAVKEAEGWLPEDGKFDITECIY